MCLTTQAVDIYPIGMSNKEVIRKAFDTVCIAMVELQNAKEQLVELHYKVEKVEDTKIVLDRVSEALPPSSDEHEAVFIQHEKAKTDLREAVTTINKASIQNYLAHAHEASSEAYAVLKQL